MTAVNVKARDFKSTEDFIQYCQDQGACIEHDYGDNWTITTSRGSAHIKRSCKTLPIEKRGVLSYLAWGLGLLTAIGGVAFAIAWLMGVA
jgi:hypothetical protein